MYDFYNKSFSEACKALSITTDKNCSIEEFRAIAAIIDIKALEYVVYDDPSEGDYSWVSSWKKVCEEVYATRALEDIIDNE